jgi:carboxypeptidase T
VLSVSTNGGADWSPLATAYTEAATGQGAQQPAGMPVFDGSQTTWVENSVDLTPYLGQADVRFRFWLGSDTGVERDGFYFDDFQIVVLREAISGVEPTPEPVVASLLAYPNPFNPQTTLRFAIDRAGPARLVIYDLQGRLVRTLLAADVIPGLQTLVWDGRTDHGAVAASGVYFARLRQSDRLETVKLMLVK